MSVPTRSSANDIWLTFSECDVTLIKSVYKNCRNCLKDAKTVTLRNCTPT